MRTPKTLYIVADGGRARYIERVGPARFSTFRNLVSGQMHEKSAALVRDRLGRVRESATTARHALEPRNDPRDKVEKAFLRSIAENLSTEDRIDEFDNLVVAAPPRQQKILIASLSPSLAAKLASRIDKNLTKVPDSDLYSHLPVFLPARRSS